MTEQFRRQRKMMLILPLIVAPLLVLVFHGLGGGAGVAKRETGPSRKGLNMSLPEAHFDPKKKALNKLGFYSQADRDSLKMLESRKQDPYYTGVAPAPAPGSGWLNRLGPDSARLRARANGSGRGLSVQGLRSDDPNEQADNLLSKLNELKGVLNRQTSAQGLPTLPGSGSRISGGGEATGLSSLPGLGGTLSPGKGPGDPDLDKLTGMLDKIIRIQHPGEAHGDTATPGQQDRTVAQLGRGQNEDGVGTMADEERWNVGGQNRKPDPGVGTDSGGVIPGSGFMELDDAVASDAEGDNLVEAMIAHDQTLVSGESVQLRLSQETVVGGVTIPAGTLLTGKSSLSGERLQVQVSSIRVGNRSVPVSLEVVDLDGVPGIREQGSINRDVAKESADEAVNTLGVTSLDPSLGGQAAAAGLQAAKTLLSRKAKLVRVSVPAGYKVFLRNTKSNRN